MKTIDQLKAENKAIIAKFPPPHNEKDKAFRKATKIVAYNNMAIHALESGVNERQLVIDMDRLRSKLTRIENNFETWQKNTSHIEQGKNPKDTYNKQNEVPKIKQQLKFIEFLLG